MTELAEYDQCPFCEHVMMRHDGDGDAQPYECAGCDCRWTYDDLSEAFL